MGIELIRRNALQALRPPANIPLAEWIEANIHLPQTASATPGRMRLWAYQRGICDAIDDPEIERVTVLKSARIGYQPRRTWRTDEPQDLRSGYRRQPETAYRRRSEHAGRHDQPIGQASAQTEAEELVSILTGNPAMSDGTAVFHASRGNLAASGVSIGSTGDLSALNVARKAMRTVKGLDGKIIVDAKPRFLLVGPESETAAEQMLAQIYPATKDDANPFASRLELIVEPRLEGVNDWWLFADPSRLASLQFAYLQSAQGVQIQRKEAWTTLGLEYRAFLDFGCGWADWRGACHNPGAA